MSHQFTIGVEEEFQIVDPTTWELRSHVSQLLVSSAPALGDQIKRELHQSIVEVGTRICADVRELRAEIFRIRRELSAAAERVGLAVAAAGTHPFSHWENQILSPGVRYDTLVEGFLAATPSAVDATAAAASGWPPGADRHGPGYVRLVGEADMDGFYYACLDKQG